MPISRWLVRTLVALTLACPACVADGGGVGIVVGLLEAGAARGSSSRAVRGGRATAGCADALRDRLDHEGLHGHALSNMARRGEISLSDAVAHYPPETVRVPSRAGTRSRSSTSRRTDRAYRGFRRTSIQRTSPIRTPTTPSTSCTNSCQGMSSSGTSVPHSNTRIWASACWATPW